MWIKTVEIQGFGTLQDAAIPLEAGYQQVVGGNGAGKTSILEFIRSCLFGWQQRGQYQRYEMAGYPFLGGRLTFVVGQERFYLQRTAEGKSKGTVFITDNAGCAVPEDRLNYFLGGISRTLFEQVFAITIDDLTRIDLLSDEDLRSHLYNIGIQTSVTIRTLEKKLEQERTDLFKPNGSKPLLNALGEERRRVQERLQEAKRNESSFFRLREQFEQAEKEVSNRTTAIDKLRMELAEIEKQKQAFPLWEEWKGLHQKLSQDLTLDSVEQRLGKQWPDTVKARLQDLESQRQQIEEDVAEAEADATKANQELQSLEQQHGWGWPSELAKLSCEELRPYLSRWENAYNHWRHNTSTNTAERWLTAIGWTLVLVWLVTSGQPYRDYVSVFFGSIALLQLVAVYVQRRNGQRVLEEVVQAAEQFRAPWKDLSAWKERFAYRERVEQQLIWQRNEHKRLEEELRKHNLRLHRVEQDQKQVRELLGVMTQREAMAVLDRLQQRQIQRERCDKLSQSLELLFGTIPKHLRMIDQETVTEHRQIVFEAQRELEQMLVETGKLRNQLDAIEQAADIEYWEGELVKLRERARPHLLRLVAIQRLERAVEEARKYFETHEQPALLRRAAFWFDKFTYGHYPNVVAPVGEQGLMVVDQDGYRWEPERLSRGTVEQLYLALRFAVIESYSERGILLPVILDEVTANFDPQREAAVKAGMEELGASHQVIHLTCHPDESAQGALLAEIMK